MTSGKWRRFGIPEVEARNREICRTFALGLSQKALAQRYELSPSMIRIILYRALISNQREKALADEMTHLISMREIYDVLLPPHFWN